MFFLWKGPQGYGAEIGICERRNRHVWMLKPENSGAEIWKRLRLSSAKRCVEFWFISVCCVLLQPKRKLIFKDTNHNYIKNTNCWNIQKLQEPRRDVGAFGFHFRFIFFHYAFFFMPLSIFEQNVHFFVQKVYPRSLIFAYLCNQMVCIWGRKLKQIRFSWVYFRQLTELLNL